MSTDRQSLADRFIDVMAEVRQIDCDVDNDHPHRYPLRLMRRTAEKALNDAISTAFEITHSANSLKRELAEIEAEKKA